MISGSFVKVSFGPNDFVLSVFFFFLFLDVILHSHVKEENVTVIGLLYTYLTVKGFSNLFSRQVEIQDQLESRRIFLM